MVWLSMRAPVNKPGIVLLICVGAFGFCMIGFALSTSFYLSLLMLFLSGAFDSVSVVIRSNILQLQTPDEMRGRVSAVNTMFIGSSNEIGAFESGLAARLLGTVPSVIFGGCMTLLVVGITSIKAPQLKKFAYTRE
jgi:sugar phosphate permease